MREPAARIRAGSPLLFWSGVVGAALAGVFLVYAVLDPATVTGARRWIKPAKFSISFALYFWTLGWMLERMALSVAWRRRIAVSVVAIMAIEIACIAGQAGRGVPSHFNETSAFDVGVYAVMGFVIGINTLVLVALATYATFRWRHADLAERAGIVAGLWLIVLGSISGALISIHGGHAVGAAEDAAGLPFVGWSNVGGDLRVAHFLGLHGFQFAPLLAALSRRATVTYIGSVLWAALVVAMLVAARAGMAVWSR